MIPQRNLSLISNTMVNAGGRRIPEAVIEPADPVILSEAKDLLFCHPEA